MTGRFAVGNATAPFSATWKRSSETLQRWLQGHPGVRVISRDRGDDYAKGAAAGAPDATQVADRWHLLHNLHEVLTRIADRCHTQVRVAAREATRQPIPVAMPAPDPPSPALDSPRPTVAQTLQQQRRARRLALYQQVVDLHREGISRREISRRLGLGRERVRHFVSAGAFPERAKRASVGQVAAYEQFLRRRWGEGCHNARTLTAELVGQGRSVSYHAVRRWVGRWRSRPWIRQESVENGVVPPVPAVLPRCSSSPNAVAWLLQRAADDLNEQEQALVDGLRRLCPDLATGADLAGEFSNLIHDRHVVDLDAWLALAQEPGSVPEMATFARGLMQDYSAVQAAVALPWSNGQVEGQVNRLKLIKRQMYGRASFDLLRRRFLCAG
jgi:transposase